MLAEDVDEATDLHVGVIEERRERLLEPSDEHALVLGQIVPGVDAGVPRRERGALGITIPSSSCRSNHRSANDVPALVERPSVLLEVLARVPGAGAWVAPNER